MFGRQTPHRRLQPVTGEQRINADDLRALNTKIFEQVGMDAADASLLADSLVFADLRGIHSHGVLRVPEYVEKLTTKGVNPKGKPHIVKSFGGCAVVDGGNSMGQIGMNFAMNEAIRRADEHGIAAVAIRGSNHSGAMAYFAIQALPHDMIGIATTNALPTMAPWGGSEKIVGINPLGIAIPAGTQLPIVHDAAFSGSSHGKIRIHQQKGLPIPESWALDKEGNPTTDPAAALDGLLRPIGEFKGVSLALIMGIPPCCPARPMALNWAIWWMGQRPVKMVTLSPLSRLRPLKKWIVSKHAWTRRSASYTTCARLPASSAPMHRGK